MGEGYKIMGLNPKKNPYAKPDEMVMPEMPRTTTILTENRRQSDEDKKSIT